MDITALQKLVQSYQQQSFNEPNLQIEISGTNPIFISFFNKEKLIGKYYDDHEQDSNQKIYSIKIFT